MEGAPTRYWSRRPNGRVECTLCPCRCRLKEGQRGACFVRACSGGEVVLTTYGRSSGFCIDPVEKKPLNHFLPGTPILSLGTAGCNLTCSFCQNWDISKSREFATLADQAAPETVARAASKLGCSSVAFTYNDPVIFLEYAVDIARACHQLDVRTVAVTAGYISPKPREELFAHMDAANIDLKGFTKTFYEKRCGAELDVVLDTLVYVKHATDVWLELTTLLIPGENDDPDELDAMTKWVVHELGPDVPMHFTAFHPDYKMLDRPRTPAGTLRRARRIAMDNGVRYAYTGNIRDAEGATTYCHGCGRPLVVRDGYAITGWSMGEGGHCPGCGAVCAGRFETQPGRWGNRREPVRLSRYARNR